MIGLLVRINLPPSNPSPSKVTLQLTWGGDSMIPSATMASFFHRGSVHDESTVLVLLVEYMALGPPIHWIIFVVGVINLGSLSNLLDGIPLE